MNQSKEDLKVCKKIVEFLDYKELTFFLQNIAKGESYCPFMCITRIICSDEERTFQCFTKPWAKCSDLLGKSNSCPSDRVVSRFLDLLRTDINYLLNLPEPKRLIIFKAIIN